MPPCPPLEGWAVPAAPMPCESCSSTSCSGIPNCDEALECRMSSACHTRRFSGMLDPKSSRVTDIIVWLLRRWAMSTRFSKTTRHASKASKLFSHVGARTVQSGESSRHPTRPPAWHGQVYLEPPHGILNIFEGRRDHSLITDDPPPIKADWWIKGRAFPPRVRQGSNPGNLRYHPRHANLSSINTPSKQNPEFKNEKPSFWRCLDLVACLLTDLAKYSIQVSIVLYHRSSVPSYIRDSDINVSTLRSSAEHCPAHALENEGSSSYRSLTWITVLFYHPIHIYDDEGGLQRSFRLEALLVQYLKHVLIRSNYPWHWRKARSILRYR